MLVILFGEHAVVYNSPAIAVPVLSLKADVSIVEDKSLFLDAKNISVEQDLTKEPVGKDAQAFSVQETIFNALKFFKVPKRQKIRIMIDSQIPPSSGLGSGTAVSIALIRALAKYYDRMLSKEDLYNLVFEADKLQHGNPSGIDQTVILNQKPVFFKKELRTMEILSLKNPLKLIIANTGLHSNTSEIVSDVKKNKEKYDEQFTEIRTITEQAKDMLLSGNLPKIGKLMNENHKLLQEIDVSSPELDKLVETALENGALGAKMTGAGRGGHMIALVEENTQEFGRALVDAGATRIFYTEIK